LGKWRIMTISRQEWIRNPSDIAVAWRVIKASGRVDKGFGKRSRDVSKNKQDNSHMLSDILQSDVTVYFFKTGRNHSRMGQLR
jgi:hypothetical protein